MTDGDSNEKTFRRLFRATLDSEVAPALTALGFETKGRGGYRAHWNEDFALATNIGESKSNKFGTEEFSVLFSIWMIENENQWVRGIWLPIPHQWRFGTSEAMSALGDRLLEGILRSAVPLAADEWGPPSDPDIAAVAAATALGTARATGEWHIPGGDS